MPTYNIAPQLQYFWFSFLNPVLTKISHSRVQGQLQNFNRVRLADSYQSYFRSVTVASCRADLDSLFNLLKTLIQTSSGNCPTRRHIFISDTSCLIATLPENPVLLHDSAGKSTPFGLPMYFIVLSGAAFRPQNSFSPLAWCLLQ